MALLKLFSGNQAKRGYSDFKDAAACRAWLHGLGRPGSPELIAAIGDFLREARQDQSPPVGRVAILDVLRVAVFGALHEHTEQDEFRALPLSTAEVTPLWALLDTAALLRDAWFAQVALLADVPPQASDDRPQITALHRAIDLHAQILMLCLTLRVVVPESAWEMHCMLGQKVRDLDAHDLARPDPLHAVQSHTCREAFVAPVFLALADPAVLNRTELQLMRAFARRFAGRVPYRIDLAGAPSNRPTARPAVNPGPVLKLGQYQVRFDSQRVYVSLEKRIEALNQGTTPAQMGMGERLSAGGARVLIVRMMRVWGAVQVDNIEAPETHWQAPPYDETLALLTTSVAADASGKKGAMPVANVNVYTYRRERRDGLTRSRDSLEKSRATDLLAAAETWRVEGVADDLWWCVRRQAKPGIIVSQLVVLKEGGHDTGPPLRVGYVEGLQQTLQADGESRLRPALAHNVRVRLLPGLPVRITAATEGMEFERPLLVLEGPIEAMAAVALEDIVDIVRNNTGQCSLIVPLATFRPGRELRIVVGGRSAKLACHELVWRGLDFDQIRFNVLP